MIEFVDSHDPILTKKTAKIDKLTKKQKEHLREMRDKLEQTKDAAAISANQLGVNLRAFVCRNGSELLTVINPSIVWTSLDNPDEIVQDEEGVTPKSVPMWEGCMSFPGKNYLINRAYSIKVDYMNEKEAYHRVTLTDQWARLFLHEIDHLNGMRVSDRAEEVMDLSEDSGGIMPTSEVTR